MLRKTGKLDREVRYIYLLKHKLHNYAFVKQINRGFTAEKCIGF